MTNKEQAQVQTQPILTGYYPIQSISKAENMDLFALIAQLWQKKFCVLGFTIITTLFAGIYAFTAKEQWTATAIINAPGYNTMSNYYQGIRLIDSTTSQAPSVEDVAEKLLKQFANQLSSYNELNSFISQSDYFKTLSKGKSDAETADLLNSMIDKVKIIKDNDNLIYTINFPSDTAIQAKQQLENYINSVNKNVSQIQYQQLTNQILSKKDNIFNQIEAIKKIALEKRQEEIKNIEIALIVAGKTNTNKPELNSLTKLDNTSLFLLGKDALTAMYDSIAKQPLVLNNEYYELQRQYINLDKIKINSEGAQAFNYLKNPIVPTQKDKPKTLLILIIGALFGLVVSGIAVLVNDTLRRENHSISS